ncbi:MAG: hypothetical protein R3F23_01750 [Verrucomicrobiia bacterium]
MALVSETATVMQALAATTKARAGAAIVVDSRGKLAGIFTQAILPVTIKPIHKLVRKKLKKL